VLLVAFSISTHFSSIRPLYDRYTRPEINKPTTTAFDLALLLDPKNYPGYKIKRDALVKLKKDSEGIEFYDKVLEIKPDYSISLCLYYR
jgi:hypothetical protein